MIDEQHIKEQISVSYAKAISAYAGVSFNIIGQDNGIDGSFRDVEYSEEYRRYSESGFNIDCQIKSTINVEIINDEVIYDLEVKNYRDLIKTNVGTPRILVLYLLPRDKNEWLLFKDESIILKKCAWWCSLKGKPNVSNTERVRVKIPVEQRLTSNELSRLMNIIKGGAEL